MQSMRTLKGLSQDASGYRRKAIGCVRYERSRLGSAIWGPIKVWQQSNSNVIAWNGSNSLGDAPAS